MTRLLKFLRTPHADQRMLARAAILHVLVTIAVRVLPFGRVRRVLGQVAAFGPRPRAVDDVGARVVRAVRTVASLVPSTNCLTEALVAQCLLAHYRCDTSLCFGVSRIRPAGRPFDAHAWLERGGEGVIGVGAVVAYDPLRHPRTRLPSPF